MGIVGPRVEGPGMRYAVVRAFVSVGVGIAVSRVVPLPWWGAAALVLLGVVLVRVTRGRSLHIVLGVAALLYAQFREPVLPDSRVYEANRFQGVVVEEPLDTDRNRMVVELRGGLRGKVQVFLRDSLCRPQYGDRVRVSGGIEPLSFPRNPGVFDYNEFLRRRGYVGKTSVASRQVRVLGHDCGNPVMGRVIVPCRRYVWGTLSRLLSGSEAALLAGLLLGDRSGLPEQTRTAFVDSGVMHVLAVSGLHVGIVVGIIWLLLSILGVRGWWKFGLAAIMVALYVVLTGGRASAVRAGVMAGAVLLAVPWQKRVEPLASLSVAGILLLLWNPQSLFDVGFHLSFAATAAIAMVMLRLREKVRGLGRWSRVGRLLRKWVLYSLAVSAAAFTGTAPLLLHHFGRVQTLVVFSSVPAALLVSIAIPLGFLVVVVNLVSSAVAGLLAGTLSLVVGWLFGLVRFFASLDWAILEPGKVPWPAVAWVYGLLLLLWNRHNRRARVWFRLGLAVGLNVLVWQAALSRPETRAVFLDPGRGDAVLLEDSLGRRMLVDAGINNKRVLRDYLRSRGIHYLDVVVVTHPDIDHYGGLLDLDDRYRIGHLVVSTTRGREVYEEMLDRFRKAGTRIVVAGKGTRIRGLGFGVQFIWPEAMTRTLYRKTLVSSNNMSLVALVDYGGFDMLLTGDLDDPELIADQEVRADLLKSPHHGSRNGNRPVLFEMVSPEYVVVMGRYPTPADLETRLAGYGDRYVNTRKDGALTIEFSPGPGGPAVRLRRVQ